MAIDTDFLQNIVDNAIFPVFEGLQTSATITLASDQDGWEASEAAPSVLPVNAIIVSWKQIDVERTTFYDLVQVNDLVALVKGSEITQEVKTDDEFTYTNRFSNTKTYKIVAIDDTFSALYSILIRSA